MKRGHLSTVTDERFIAQLGIISIQNRIDSNNPLNRHWISQFTVQGVSYQVEGFAADFGRPRGIDTDVQLAIETLFLLQGCPEHNTVHTTAHEVLVMCNMANKGTNYPRLRESLMRLWRVGFLVSKAQYTEGSPWATYINETLNLFQRVRFTTSGSREGGPDLSSMVKDGKLLVQLSEPLADSIRAGYTHALDRRLLAQIEQPAGRGTYRILQAHRPAQGPLEVRLSDWAAACGIFSDQPDKIRRTLQSAHDELVSNAYLDGVEYTGRGAQQSVTYHFRATHAGDPALVQLLMQQSIPRPRAETLAAQYPSHIEQVVRYVQQRRSQGKVKSPGGLTTDILLHPEKYDLSGPAAPEQALGSGANARREEALKQAAEAAEKAHAEQQATLLRLPPQAQWAGCQATLKVLTARLLSAEQWSILEQRCISGQIEAAPLTRELSALVGSQERKAHILSVLQQA
ncbi:replication initiator protein A [Deinococcus radiophilus]|uniref:Plasmid replication initiator protein n=1 Tax=Deinococcus radiophilus TaxID=32062 RepID=A0A3S0I351_9DEIO|nr:replication initiator protein A [Deinococcus radiophilus]RTR26351.1 hypothetical protein EJ104_08400 [Deinococcus radiophilus]